MLVLLTSRVFFGPSLHLQFASVGCFYRSPPFMRLSIFSLLVLVTPIGHLHGSLVTFGPASHLQLASVGCFYRSPPSMRPSIFSLCVLVTPKGHLRGSLVPFGPSSHLQFSSIGCFYRSRPLAPPIGSSHPSRWSPLASSIRIRWLLISASPLHLQ